MSDLDERLARWREKRRLATDPHEIADIDEMIAALEEKLAASTSLQHQSGAQRTATTVAGNVSGPLLSGVFYGSVTINGERPEERARLLGRYLQQLHRRCGAMPLLGLRDQRSADDVLAVDLAQVYTQLATTTAVQRDYFSSQTLQEIDIVSLVQGDQEGAELPAQQRTMCMVTHPDYATAHRRLYEGAFSDTDITPDAGGVFQLALGQPDTPDRVARLREGATSISFHGPKLVTEALATHQRLVLLGEPGSGKSTALRYLALTLAEAALDPSVLLADRLAGWERLDDAGQLLPTYVPLLPLAKRLAARPNQRGRAADLWAHLAATLEYDQSNKGLAAAVHEELRAGNVLLLLDGLDEVAGSDSRRQVVECVADFARSEPQCRMVVACRVRAYLGDQNADWRLPGWHVETLADWTRGQMLFFIDAWYRAAASSAQLTEERRIERTEQLTRALSVREDLQQLGERPLLLTIMALVHLNDGRLPEDRVSLYSRCIDILLDQWEELGRDENDFGRLMAYIGLPDSDVKRLRPLLEEIAYQAHMAGTKDTLGRIGRDTLQRIVQEALDQLKHPNPFQGAKRFLEYTDVRAGLLQASDAGDAYSFPHQTFQEYLAGLALVRDVKFVDRIMERRSDDRWRVPIFLAIGHSVSEGILSVPHQLLSELLAADGRDPEDTHRDYVLAADLADDVAWDRLEKGGAAFKKLRRDLADALVRVVTGTILPAAERVRMGAMLGTLGDPRPGVVSFPPAMVAFAEGKLQIGNTQAEYQAIIKAEKRNNLRQEATDWYKDSVNTQTISVAPFELARYPLTNAQWALFMTAGGYQAEQPWWDAAGRAWLQQDKRTEPPYWRHDRFGYHYTNHPVVAVTWYESIAFCRWLTLHLDDGYTYTLPSELEWEYAARGAGRRVYSWGDQEPNGERANFNSNHQGTTAVGCFPAGATPEGLFDLAGNVWEWNRSEYQSYPYDPHDGREDGNEPAKKEFTLRGGGWRTRPIILRASYRNHGAPGLHNSSLLACVLPGTLRV